MPVFTEEPLTCTRGMDLSSIRFLKPVAPIICFGQQGTMATWNLTWNLGPFGMRMLPLIWMYPLNYNSKETRSTQGQIPFRGAGCFCFKPLILEWPYYKIDRQRHARTLMLRFQATKKEPRRIEKSLVHHPMSRRRSERALSDNPRRRQGGVEFENEHIPELIRTSQRKSGRRGGRHDKREYARGCRDLRSVVPVGMEMWTGGRKSVLALHCLGKSQWKRGGGGRGALGVECAYGARKEVL
ncbi:hypothetical protein B0H13DRAFT_2454231 [Mycena leptocephala]|nr:hypothetical protein B0H13DRAFT_2454231 [Mycena leptocephala]